MAGLLDELIVTLESQYENLSDLVELSKEKKDVIISNDVDTLQKITNLEGRLINRNEKLIKKHDELFQNISIVMNMDYETLSLKSLSDKIKNKDDSKKLIDISCKFELKVKELKDINECNNALLKVAVEYANYNLNLFKDNLSSEPTYFSTSGEEMEKELLFFDIRQ